MLRSPHLRSIQRICAVLVLVSLLGTLAAPVTASPSTRAGRALLLPLRLRSWARDALAAPDTQSDLDPTPPATETFVLPAATPTPAPPPADGTLDEPVRPAPSAALLTLTSEGGELSSPDGVVKLSFASDLLAEDVALRLTVTIPEATEAQPVPMWLVFDLEPLDSTLEVDGHFRLPEAVTVTVDLQGFPAWRIPHLMHRLDEEKDEWEFLPAQYDAETQLLVGQAAQSIDGAGHSTLALSGPQVQVGFDANRNLGVSYADAFGQLRKVDETLVEFEDIFGDGNLQGWTVSGTGTATESGGGAAADAQRDLVWR